MYVYIYPCVSIYIYMHVPPCIYIIYMNPRVQLYVPTCIHIYMYLGVYMQPRYVYIYMYPCLSLDLHAPMCMQTYLDPCVSSLNIYTHVCI